MMQEYDVEFLESEKTKQLILDLDVFARIVNQIKSENIKTEHNTDWWFPGFDGNIDIDIIHLLRLIHENKLYFSEIISNDLQVFVRDLYAKKHVNSHSSIRQFKIYQRVFNSFINDTKNLDINSSDYKNKLIQFADNFYNELIKTYDNDYKNQKLN